MNTNTKTYGYNYVKGAPEMNRRISYKLITVLITILCLLTICGCSNQTKEEKIYLITLLKILGNDYKIQEYGRHGKCSPILLTDIRSKALIMKFS